MQEAESWSQEAGRRGGTCEVLPWVHVRSATMSGVRLQRGTSDKATERNCVLVERVFCADGPGEEDVKPPIRTLLVRWVHDKLVAPEFGTR